MSTQVCKQFDSYTTELEIDKGQALWVAKLSNGELIIQDDGRPGVTPHSAWLRLASYLDENPDLTIYRLWIRFRDNIHEHILPANSDGYYFAKLALGCLTPEADQQTLSFYRLGALNNGKLEVQMWKVPELLLVESKDEDEKLAGSFLIRNRSYTNASSRYVEWEVEEPPTRP